MRTLPQYSTGCTVWSAPEHGLRMAPNARATALGPSPAAAAGARAEIRAVHVPQEDTRDELELMEAQENEEDGQKSEHEARHNPIITVIITKL